MKGIYPPFIIRQAEEVLKCLIEDITVTDQTKEDLCIILTKKFIEGDLNEGVEVFESEEEVDKFISLCRTRFHLKRLQEMGMVDSFDDNESFFLTEKGIKYLDQFPHL